MVSSDEVGRRLLGQVEELGFDEVLQSLRKCSESNHVRHTNVPEIDRMLDTIMQRDPLKKTPVLNIISEYPNVGTESMIYYILAALALPAWIGRRFLGGAGSAVVLCDPDMRFNVSKLADVMRSFMKRAHDGVDENMDAKMIDGVIETAMQHVHIFSPQSLSGMTATITSLTDTLLQVESHYSGNRALGAVMLCDLSSFFWQNKMELEFEQELQHAATDQPTSTGASGYNGLVAALRACHERFGCTIVATTWATSLSRQAVNRPAHHTLSMYPLFPSVWSSFCALSLVITQQAVPKFSNDMTLTEIWADAPARQKALDSAKYTASMHPTPSHERHDGTRQALKLGDSEGAFQFTVTDRGFMVLES